MIIRPIKATRAPLIKTISAPLLHLEKSTRLTSVAGLDIIIPAFFSPMIVINRPIPGVMAVLTASGIDLIMASLRPIAVITMKNIPDINTITSACP